jgi:hypothetical protein
MPAIVVRDMPVEMHRRLKSAALQHHRSMNREVLAILEQTLETHDVAELPPPVKGKRPVDPRWIVQVIREARDGKP